MGAVPPLVALPVLKDEETIRVAGLLNVILFSALGILAFYSVMMALTIPEPVALGFLVGFAVSILCLHALMRRGHVRLAI